ncbi:MAG TPA: hypothetical protein VL359_12365 [bacterium]|nr:hypothetical protein [bacterium]
MAQKVVFTAERERDQDRAMENIAATFLRNLAQPDLARYFIDMIDVLLEDEETMRYAGLSWVSLIVHHEDQPAYAQMVSNVLDTMILDHQQIVKPNYVLDYRRKAFSHYARNLGDAFIAMMQIKTELYEVVSHLYSMVIRKEVGLENAEKQRASGGGHRITLGEREQEKPKTGKKLFDDVVDYVHARGEIKPDTLSQQNPNEFIAILADRMRGTRRYVIQDIMSKAALDRRKEVEKELSERLASAEEIMQARDAFHRSLDLFWAEKRYNIKYMSVEKIRVTLQVITMCVGILYFLAGYLGVSGMHWWEGLIVAVAMYGYARVMASKQAFRNFFPHDVSKDLEVVLGTLTPTLRKMSEQQMDTFMVRQVKDPRNLNLLPIMPEFFKYVFAVMPDRASAIVQADQLRNILQNMELDIARVIRTSGVRLAS